MKRSAPIRRSRRAPKRTRRAWNSTLPAPTKRIERKTKLAPAGATKRKKRKRYAAYLRSAAWQAKRLACLERAQGRCEYRMPDGYRCGATADHVHHTTYVRFHHELPEDLQALCRMHHEFIERTQFPHRKHA